MWFAVSGVLFVLGLVPAMPQLLILPASAIAGTIGWRLRKAAQVAEAAPPPAAPAPDPHHIEWADVSDVGPCQLEIGYALVALVEHLQQRPAVAGEGGREALAQCVPVAVRREVEERQHRGLAERLGEDGARLIAVIERNAGLS